jgi:hypothetical protein
MRSNVEEILKGSYQLEERSYNAILESTRSQFKVMKGNLFSRTIKKYFVDKRSIAGVKKILRQNNLAKRDIKNVIKLIKNEISLNNRIDRLQTMQKLFKYWHVAHLPFAIIMLIIMVIHVGITLTFGYTWIF